MPSIYNSATQPALATPFDLTAAGATGLIGTNVQDNIIQIWETIFSSPSGSQTVNVAKNGNDTTGNGSAATPFLTIGAAMTSITDSSPTKRYTIQVGTGDYPENLVLKANVFIVGASPIATRITGTTLNINDATWNVSTADNRSGFMDISVNATCTFDFTAQAGNDSGKLYFWNIRTAAAWTCTALGAVNQLVFHDSEFFGNTTFNGLTTFILSSMWQSGNIAVNSSSLAGIVAALTIVGGATNGNIAATWTSQQPVTLTLQGINISAATTLTASGASCTVVANNDSLPIPANRTFSASAVLTRVGDNFAGGLLSATTNVTVSAATAPTAGQSLVASGSAAAAWGPATSLTAQELNFSSNITTTSTSSTNVMTGMTVTPAAGSYLVWFSAWLTHSNGNDTVNISILSGGVQKADSIRTCVPFCGAIGAVNDGIEVGTNGLVTVNGSQAIAIQWSTNAGTATAHSGTMNILRVA